MRRFLVSVLIATLFASDALAANAPPLDPGRPAGVRQAQLQEGMGMMVVAGAALVGITVALATASNGAAPPSTATSATSTTANNPTP